MSENTLRLDLFDWEEDSQESEYWQNTASQPFSDEQLVDAAFGYFRDSGFPYPSLPLHVCMQQINRLARTPQEQLLTTSVGYSVADTYHPHRYHSSVTKMRAPHESFMDDGLLRQALALHLHYEESIGQGLPSKIKVVSGTQACSNFRPGFASYVYRRFCEPGDTVLDTSTGYGGRLVGFMASGVAGRYIGIDPSKRTHVGNLQMALDLGFADSVELHNLPAEDVSPDIVNGRCDFAFTSPPYFSKEIYADEETQSCHRYKTFEEWLNGFLAPMLRLQFLALSNGAFSVLNVADVTIGGKRYPLQSEAIKAAEAVGFTHELTERFELSKRFGKGQGEEVSFEPLLIFRKKVVQPI